MSQKMSLNQVLAPQLQQSLNLLQAPMLELKAMVDQELQLNPVLEEHGTLNAEERDMRESSEGESPRLISLSRLATRSTIPPTRAMLGNRQTTFRRKSIS